MASWNPKANEIFLAAVELPDPAARRALLDQRCGSDAGLRAEVEALLAAADRPATFLDRPAAAPFAPTATAPADPGGPTAEFPPGGEAGRLSTGTSARGWSGRTADYLPGGEAGAVIAGRYTLLERIGEGGMGEVWVAKQTEPVQRKVAVKLIKAGMDSKAVLARFEAERQALALMDHPNIARVLDGGLTERGRPFFVMELVNGLPLTAFCDRMKLTPRERLELFVPVCQAVQHAHQKGIVHRDLKPSNVLVTLYDGRPVPKIIDFGVAKATGGKLTEQTISTQFGAVVGTLEYMAPEQAGFSALDVDTRADIYALGVILYELLTGLRPFDGQRLRAAALDEVLRVIREEEPPRPSTRLSTDGSLPAAAAVRQTEPRRLMTLLQGELDWVVMKCLEKDRSRRYETANALAREVQRYLADEPVEARPPSPGYRLRKVVRRHRRALATAVVIALLLVAGTAVSTWQAVRATRAERRAAEQAELERQAKQDAEEQKTRAEAAAAAEAVARRESQKRLAQIETGNEIVTSIFIDLDLRAVKASGEPLEAVLAQRLVKAAAQLEGEAVGDPLAVAALQDRLGRSLLSLGHPRPAIDLFVKARATRSSALGADHPDTLASMNNLAEGYHAAGQLDKALPLLEETLKLMKAKLGADHPDTLTSMNNLALGYRDAGQLDKALPLYEETLKLMKAKLGADHPDTLTSMNNLAAGYHAAGQLDKALPLLEETLKLRKAKLGADHPDTLTSMNNLALGYDAAGQLDKALPLYEETLKLRKAKLGADHLDTLISMDNLAGGYHAAGQLDKALPLYEETLKLMKAKLGADHPDTLASMNNLAQGYRAAGQLDKALPLYETAARGVEQRRFRHEYANRIIPNTIRAYEEAKQFDRAEAWQRKWLAHVQKQAGADSPAYAAELAALGLNLLQQQKWADAEATLRDCLAIRQQQQPDAWTTFNAQSMLGGALLGQKQYAEAEPLLLAGYAGLKERAAKIPANGKLRLPEAADRLVELYAAWGKPAEAAKWRAERAKYPPEPAPPPRPVR